MDNHVLIDAVSLRQFTKEVFVAVGLPPDEADIEAEVLVWANLRGVDSHGVQRIPIYVREARAGRIKVAPDIRVEKETPCLALLEADHAFGAVVTVQAMEMAMEKAAQVGIGWVLIRNTSHQGAMGYYPLLAARRDMAGMAWVCGPPNMAPYGARAAGVHNSPIAIAVPGKTHPPLLLDMATSVAAQGKVTLALDRGVSIPDTWALDKEGRPTTDPQQAVIMRPAGLYKGSGLAFMFECLSGLMVGNPLIYPRLMGLDTPPGTQNSVVVAINIALCTDIELYKQRVDELASAIKSLPPAEGFSEVLVPGEPEDRTAMQRQQEGIPIPLGTARRLREVATDLRVSLPPALRAG